MTARTDLADCTATELLALYRSGQASPTEATQAVLARIGDSVPALSVRFAAYGSLVAIGVFLYEQRRERENEEEEGEAGREEEAEGAAKGRKEKEQ